MVHVVGASSLEKSIKKVGEKFRKEVTAISGLSICPNRNPLKNLNFLLRNGKLGSYKRLVFWHDLINNSVTKHPSNCYKPFSTPEVIDCLKNIEQLAAIVYCRRVAAPDIYDDLKKAGFLVISVTRNIISKRKRADSYLRKRYLQLHQEPNLELKSLAIVLKYRGNLRRLVNNQRSKKRRPSQSRRKAKQRAIANK